jgi:DNA repair exonuclease SbcCD ATPase subunit
MWIKELRLHNWMPYRGETVLHLEPKPYAIVARRKDNPEESNWAGKSAIFEAIYFVLFGKLNPDRNMGADGWITDGEKSGSVTVVFNTGDVVKRSRKLGKSTQLQLTKKEWIGERKDEVAKGDEAQAILNAMLGISDPDDFLATCYFLQRQMARLVLADPGTRMEYVSTWFQLGKLERAEELLRDQLARMSWQADTHKQRLELLKSLETQEAPEDVQVIYDQMNQVNKKLDEAKAKYSRLQTLLEKNRTYADAPNIVSEHEALQAEVKSVTKKLGSTKDANLKQTTERVREVQELYAIHSRNEQSKRKLVAGKFEGICPLAEIRCPATDEINSQRKLNERMWQSAKTECEAAETQVAAARMAHENAQEAHDEWTRLNDQLSNLHARIARNTRTYEEAKQAPPAMDFEELREKVTAAHRDVTDLSMQLNALQRSITVVTESRREAVSITLQLDTLNKQIETHREALVIFGKQGAQRRVAEPALQQIQEDSNAMMAECGIKLEVDVSWSREGSGIAKTCDACGHPFPSSARVKSCEKCQAPRGANLVNKLDIILSEQSAAAEDLVGAGFQLSASAWLRENRGVLWSAALIDEPFAHCDRANRRALATFLARQLTRPGGFDQAFVISHTTDTDAFPGLIEVVRDGQFSKVEVVT